ncbi:MAG: hypothetical protein ACKVS6_10145 [Planctomycetota bacterium]
MQSRIVLLLFFILAVLASERGPDFYEYSEWSRAAASGDLSKIESETRSPLGVPTSQWAHGTGFLFSIPRFILGDWVSDKTSARIASAAAMLLLFVSFVKILEFAARGDRRLAAFGMVITILATHAGYYSLAFSSELLSLSAFSLLLYFAIAARTFSWVSALGAGAAAAVLVTIRTQLVLYAVFGLGICIWRVWCARRESRWRTVISSLLLSVPIACAAVQVAFTRRWMTGSPWTSPYLFGDEKWKSVEFGNWDRIVSLVHPWHGFIIYHPIYLLGFLWITVFIFVETARSRRLALVALACVLAAHLIHQSAWYCWWFGLKTFGSRGFAMMSIQCIPICVYAMQTTRRKWIGRTMLIIAAWSYLLMIHGDSNFTTWSQLLEAQADLLQTPAFVVPLAALLLIVIFNVGARRPAAPYSRAAAFGGAAFVYFLVQRALLHLEFNLNNHPALEISAGLVSVVAGVVATRIVLAGFVSNANILNRQLSNKTDAFTAVAAFAVSIIFIIECATFARLAVNAESAIASGAFEANLARPRASFQWEALNEARAEYDLVPGFGSEKTRLVEYLERAAATAAPR